MPTDTSSTGSVGSIVFQAIPPSLDSREYNAVIHDLKSLNIFNDSIITEYEKDTCRSSSTTSTDPSPTTQIKYIQTRIDKYQNDLYTAKDVTARNNIQSIQSDDDGKQQIEIRTYVETIDNNNCMSSSWKGIWNIKIITEKSVELSGTISIHIHYYERGSNIQTRTERYYPIRIVATREEKVTTIVKVWEKEKMSYEEQLSNVITKEIIMLESLLYNDLQEMYTTQLSSNLRQVRRILPITKTRFKWDTAAQKQVKLLNEKSTTK